MLRVLMISFQLVTALAAHAQDARFYGGVRKWEADQPLSGAEVHVLTGGTMMLKFLCDSMGSYDITLDVGRVYGMEYHSAGRTTKRVLLDLRDAPTDDGGYNVNVDIRLFEVPIGIDVDFLNEPLGQCRYYPEKGSIGWDMVYTAPRMERLRTLFPDQYEVSHDSTGSAPDHTIDHAK